MADQWDRQRPLRLVGYEVTAPVGPGEVVISTPTA